MLRVLLLYFQIAIFEPELRERTLRTTFVLQNCDFRAEAAGTYSAYYFQTNPSRQLESPTVKINFHGNSYFTAISDFLIDLQK